MRRIAFVALGAVLLAGVPVMRAMADPQSDDDARRAAQDAADKKKKAKEKEYQAFQAPLPTVTNAGPCPYVKVLYDAARYVELKGGVEKAENVGWTGEIESVRSGCAYQGGEPIHVKIAVDFSLGKGPEAEGSSKDYRYWVAVTARNQAVIDKKYFDIVGDFKPGQDRINVSDTLDDVVIPRASAKVSGSNFEVLVGFDVTPAMAAFNRQGKRFRENVGAFVAQGKAGDPGRQ